VTSALALLAALQVGGAPPTSAPSPTAPPLAPLPEAAPAPIPVVVTTPAPATIWSVPIAHSLGVLAGMRLGLSLIWPAAYDPTPFSRSTRQFASAYNRPPEYHGDRSFLESDGDPWSINVIGHGLFGSEIYNRVRQCGGASWQAFAFTAATSAVWEYGIEAFSKRPSALDLVLTPMIGTALGEARYRAHRWLKERPRGFWRTLGAVLVDPFGEGERVVLGTRC
jgi:hypothetical protein